MALNSYLSINTLNVNGPNGPNAPIKKHKVSEWIHLYAPYKKLILDMQIEREEMEKNLSCKWISKESWSSNTCIGQTRL